MDRLSNKTGIEKYDQSYMLPNKNQQVNYDRKASIKSQGHSNSAGQSPNKKTKFNTLTQTQKSLDPSNKPKKSGLSEMGQHDYIHHIEEDETEFFEDL